MMSHAWVTVPCRQVTGCTGWLPRRSYGHARMHACVADLVMRESVIAGRQAGARAGRQASSSWIARSRVDYGGESRS